MSNQLTSNAEALRLFFTDDIYLIAESKSTLPIGAEKITEETAPPNEPAYRTDEIITFDNKIQELPTIPQKNKPEYKYLGKNQKNILILVNDEQNEVSSEQGRELLRKLVKAINLTANDFALLNYSGYTSEKYEDLKAFFNCKLLLAFGVNAVDLDLPTQPLHQLVNYHESKILFAKNLDELDKDIASKKILWASLQQLK